jgi:hypothetical protein
MTISDDDVAGAGAAAMLMHQGLLSALDDRFHETGSHGTCG